MKQKLFLCLPVLALIGLLPFPMDAASTATGTGHEESRTSLQQKKAVRTLTGTVTDASTGEFLVGVSIRIKGTSQGTITDLNGEFSIQVTSDTELEVTYIGYKKQTLLVGDLGVMAIRMQSDDEVLDEIVIIGAGTQKKVSVTGSISTIEGSTLKSPSSSLTNALAGKLAGVISMTQTGEPGANQNFYIRGINTFGGVATPLILLDGVEISVGDLNNIPPESIESFSILKDASATAIYGNRGANGVMLVNTKNGAENTKAKINVSLECSYFQPVNVTDFADGVTYMENYTEAQLARSTTGNVALKYTQERIDNTRAGVNPYVFPNVDWYDLIFKKGNYNQRANINVQGGGPRVTYYMSLQANHDTGLLNAPSDYIFDNNINTWTYNFQNNIAYKVTNTTEVNLRMMAQINNNKGPGYSTADMFGSVINANPVAFPAWFPRDSSDPEGIIRYGNTRLMGDILGQNPYEYMLSSYKETNWNTLNTSLSVKQDLGVITEGLSLNALVNFKNYAISYYTHSITPYYYAADPASWSAEQPEKYNVELLQTGNPYLNQGSIQDDAAQTFYLDARLDWKRSFGRHNVTAMLMYMMREYRNDVLPSRNQGYSGRFTYDWSNRYLVEFNFGYNGSERLKEHRFEFFPAMSLGWVVSEEKFWKPLAESVSFLKLRGSYGLVGSDQFDGSAPRFLYQNQIAMGGVGPFWTGMPDQEIQKSGPAFQTFAIQDAGWEHVRKLNIGVDAELFHQLRITLDYFRDIRTRILMARASWPAMLGYGGAKPWSNIGEVENRGVELSLNWKTELADDLWIDLRGNFTYNQNEYKYVDEPAYPYIWQTKTGKPLNTLTGYVAEGLFESEQEIAEWPDQSQLGASIRPGDIKYRDVDGDGQITSEDQVMLSPYNSIPRIQYGLGLNLTYKRLDFGVFFNGSAQRKIMINNIKPFVADDGTVTLDKNLMQWIADSHWSESNPDPHAGYPRLGTTSADVANNMVASSYWMRNGNFIRFKTLEVGYTFPYCRVYFTGDNLAVFSPFKLWDPELSWNTYPLQRTFNIGVQFTF